MFFKAIAIASMTNHPQEIELFMTDAEKENLAYLPRFVRSFVALVQMFAFIRGTCANVCF
jgi:hypothetical protein